VWLVWALAAAACVELAPSPVYVALVIAYTLMIGLRYRREKAELRHKTVGANDTIR